MFESKSDTVRGIEARSVAGELGKAIGEARLPNLLRTQPGPDFWSEFTVWALAVAENLAMGNVPSEDRFKARWVNAAGSQNGEVMERGDLTVWRHLFQVARFAGHSVSRKIKRSYRDIPCALTDRLS